MPISSKTVSAPPAQATPCDLVRREGRQSPSRGLNLVIAALLLAIYAIQGVWFIRTQSFSWDEPLHLQAGIEEWRSRSFKFIADHPPLGHLLPAALVAHDKNVQLQFVFKPGVADLVHVSPDPEYVAHRTRPLVLVFGLILGVLLWCTARSFFSEGAANFALALFAFSPGLIAHFSMITTDGVTTLAYFATAVQVMRWRRNPSRAQTALLGLLLGLLLLSKLHAPAFVALALLFVLIENRKDWHEMRAWRWRPAIAAAALAFFVLWAGYFFHISHFTTQRGTLYMTFPPNPNPTPVNFVMERDINLWVPAGEYVYGFIQTLQHNGGGHAKFMFGSWSFGYMPLLYPMVIALKWPPIVLLLLACSVALLATRKVKLPREWTVMAVFPLSVLVLAMISRIASGERHLLPAYPFALLFASATWEYARTVAVRKRLLAAVLLIAVAANAVDVLRYAPDYLSYFNPLVRPTESYRLLSFSDLDWGQGLLALKKYQSEHPNEDLYVATVGVATPASYGIRATRLKPNEFHSGTIVVGATSLSGFTVAGQCGYCWVQQYPMKTMLNHSLFVYEVPPTPGH